MFYLISGENKFFNGESSAMRRIYFGLFWLLVSNVPCICFGHITVYNTKEQSIKPDSGHHYIIEFVHTARDNQQKREWIEGIKRAIEQTQNLLIEKKLIAPEYKKDTLIFTSFLEQAYYTTKEVLYDVFFHTYTLTYPKRINKPFITRNNQQVGSLGIYLPDGVLPEMSLDILRKELKKQGVSVTVIPDYSLHPMIQLPETCCYVGFDYATYKACKNGTLRKKYEQRLQEISGSTQQRIKTYKELDESKKIEKALALFNVLEPQLQWHLSFPTTGIAVTDSPWKHNYPFLPHQFPLWQMAPQLGAGITIAFIDTGISSFSVEPFYKNNKTVPKLRKTDNLQTAVNYNEINTNLVGADGLNPFDHVIECIEPYLKKPVDSNNLEKQIILWIQEYLEYKTTKKVIDYLQQKGVSELFESSTKLVTHTGQVALQKLTELMSQFTLVSVTDGNKKSQKVVLECLPLAPLVQDKYKTLMMGHGSHAVGVAAGMLENNAIEKNGFEPSIQEGIYGIAPQAHVVMIKAFSDTATTHQSTMIAGLLKAAELQAQIVNMSLKIADYNDRTTEYSKSLTAAIEKIPYCVAASGNDGDPTKQGHAGPGLHVEAYPARLDGIAFDVGAFAYNHSTGMCPIPAFSQYQLSGIDSKHQEQPVSIGPKFLAPGYNIISSGLLPEQKENSAAVMMHGTSTAAPQISGFLALMLSEFGDEFTRDQYLKVCYSSGIKLMDSPEWKERSIFGALDMRTVLFTLHVLRVIKKSSEHNKQYLENNFDHCVVLLHDLLFSMVDNSFRNNFCHFYKEVQKQFDKKIEKQVPDQLLYDFNKAIQYCAQEVLIKINSSTTKKVLFDNVHPAVHNRIQAALKNTGR